jgi:DNA-binding transcriptional regulator YhcF (GntR family)
LEPFNKTIESASATPIYRQVMDMVIEAVKGKLILKGDKLPSVNAVSKELKIANGTIVKAYEELKKMGLIDAQQGKAFYVIKEDVKTTLNIFILADRLTTYKEILFHAFMHEFDADVTIDFNFHNYNYRKFEKLLLANLGYYNYYIVMPHFHEDAAPLLQQIPLDKLMVLDALPENLNGKFAAVYQNFYRDVFQSFEAGMSLFRKYKSVILVLDKNDPFQYLPKSIITGFTDVCTQYQLSFQILDDLQVADIEKGNAYFLISDSTLVEFLKQVAKNRWNLGSDIGLIAYDDTPTREILAGGITVISTDFKQMGLTAARLIKENSKETIANPCQLIVRNSL